MIGYVLRLAVLVEYLKQTRLTPILHSSFYILHFKKPMRQILLATLLVLFGVILITGGFFAPPTGVIDASVLTAFGEILTFAGALFGIDAKYKSKLT